MVVLGVFFPHLALLPGFYVCRFPEVCLFILPQLYITFCIYNRTVTQSVQVVFSLLKTHN